MDEGFEMMKAVGSVRWVVVLALVAGSFGAKGALAGKRYTHPPRATLTTQVRDYMVYAKGVDGGGFYYWIDGNITAYGQGLLEVVGDHVVTNVDYMAVLKYRDKYPGKGDGYQHKPKACNRVRAMIQGMRTNLASLADEGPDGTEAAAERVVSLIAKLAKIRGKKSGTVKNCRLGYVDAVNRALVDNRITEAEIGTILTARPAPTKGMSQQQATQLVNGTARETRSRRRPVQAELREALAALDHELRHYR